MDKTQASDAFDEGSSPVECILKKEIVKNEHIKQHDTELPEGEA